MTSGLSRVKYNRDLRSCLLSKFLDSFFLLTQEDDRVINFAFY